jgi:predicted ATPase
MRLVELNIKNYKSLGDVTFRPESLSVLVGPNGAGKSNFASALSFLTDVYEFGLETAISRKGGFENIAMRSISGTPEIEFEVVIELSSLNDIAQLLNDKKSDPLISAFNLIFEEDNHSTNIDNPVSSKKVFQFSHSFSIISLLSTNLDFVVKNERIRFYSPDSQVNKSFIRKRPFKLPKNGGSGISSSIILALTPQKLGISFFYIYFDVFELFKKYVTRWSLYQLNPLYARNAGSSTPNPEINIYGDNLPSLIDWLKSNHPEKWASIVNILQSVLPTLANIRVEHLHNRRLGLFFYEIHNGRPWNSEEVSDGTILTLSILCAIFDPRKSLVVIEEIENSLHPWALRTLIEEIRSQSKEKNIILTTHSPTVIDMLYPQEIWCLSKPESKTHLDRLVDLAPNIEEDWKNGDVRLSDYLDAGLVPNAVPGGLL